MSVKVRSLSLSRCRPAPLAGMLTPHRARSPPDRRPPDHLRAPSRTHPARPAPRLRRRGRPDLLDPPPRRRPREPAAEPAFEPAPAAARRPPAAARQRRRRRGRRVRGGPAPLGDGLGVRRLCLVVVGRGGEQERRVRRGGGLAARRAGGQARCARGCARRAAGRARAAAPGAQEARRGRPAQGELAAGAAAQAQLEAHGGASPLSPFLSLLSALVMTEHH